MQQILLGTIRLEDKKQTPEKMKLSTDRITILGNLKRSVVHVWQQLPQLWNGFLPQSKSKSLESVCLGVGEGYGRKYFVDAETLPTNRGRSESQ